MSEFDQLYRESKRQAGLLDFADLEECTVRLLEEHPETRARLQGQFDHILMDEFQDTNGQQARLMRLVRPPDRFYAVGDINQSIFGFRHAEPEGFSRYRDQIAETGALLARLRDTVEEIERTGDTARKRQVFEWLVGGLTNPVGQRAWVPSLVYAFVGFLLIALGLLVGRRRAMLRVE